MIKKTLIITLLVVLVALATCMTASAFDLEIDGVKLSDVYDFNDLFGDGVYSFDTDTDTLTVHRSPSDPELIYCTEDGFTINLSAGVTLGEIRLYGSTVITGEGALTAHTIDPYGMLVIDHTSVTALFIGSDAKKLYGDLTIQDSYVEAIFGKFNNISQAGCELISPSNYSVQCTDGTIGGEIVPYYAILNSYDVMAKTACIFAPWGDYGVIIAGTTVTEENRDDILGNGVFSYDAGSTTLTVSGKYNSLDRGIVIAGLVDGLTVNVTDPDAKLESYTSSQIRLYGNTEILGKGKLSFGPGNLPAIEVMDGADLYLTDIRISAVHSSRDCAIMGSGGALEITEAELYLRGQDAAVSGFDDISLHNCDLTYPEGAYVSGAEFCDADGSVSTYITIKPAEKYDLWVMGEQITSTNCDRIRGGVNAYDPENKILYIRDNMNNSPSSTQIDSGIEGLTIRVEGSRSLKSGHKDRPVIVLRADTTIMGDSLFLRNTAGGAALTAVNGDEAAIHLNIENISMNISGGFGIISNPFGAALSFTGAEVTITASGLSNSGAVVGFTGGITFHGCEITEPQGASVNASKGAIYVGGAAAREVVIAGGYELYIDDIRVTRENMSDVTGGGVFAYDPVEKTLSIHGDYTASSADTLISNVDIDGLIVRVTAASVLEAPISCIYANADTMLTGDAKLSLKAEERVVEFDDCDFMIAAAELVLRGDYGIYGYNGRLSIGDSNLTITSNYEAICSMAGSPMAVTLVQEAIVSPGGAKLTDGDTRFTDLNGNPVRNLRLASTSCYRIEFAFVEYRFGTEKLKVTLSAQSFAPDAILVAAFYDPNGRFIGASSADINKSTKDVSVDNRDGSFKIFICDAVGKQPLAIPYPAA